MNKIHEIVDAPALAPLENGDHLDQKTFHARYEAMPPDTRAELIGGIVFMPSPLKRPHGRLHVRLNGWLLDYEDATPGVQAFDNATTILNDENEPQPDSCLLIATGGQTRDEDEYIAGSPELLIEVASSSESIDLHRKKDEYEQADVKEYLVIALRQRRVYWFVRRGGRFEELAPGQDGILRSEVFPGLWLDPAALLQLDGRRLKEVLRQGLATPEHAAFVAKLAGSAGGPPPSP
jgi:Uma2 family endonuclease